MERLPPAGTPTLRLVAHRFGAVGASTEEVKLAAEVRRILQECSAALAHPAEEAVAAADAPVQTAGQARDEALESHGTHIVEAGTAMDRVRIDGLLPAFAVGALHRLPFGLVPLLGAGSAANTSATGGDEGGGANWMDGANVVVALAALLVAISQAILVKQQARRGEVTLTRDLIAAWHDVTDAWRLCMAVEDLGEGFYSPHVTEEERAKLDRLGKLPDDSRRTSNDEQVWLSGHGRNLVSALGRIADLVLSGRASVQLAYTVLGHELTRRSRPLRSMLFNQHERWWGVDTLGSQAGTRERILALVDLMWAEAVRRGDLSPHVIAKAAKLKRERTGAQSRKRVRDLSRSMGASRFTAHKLAKSLEVSEVPPSG